MIAEETYTVTMDKYICTTPVVLIIFNRPEETKALIDSLRSVQPKKLFIIADGPREGHPSDSVNTRDTRDLVDSIDWDCELIKLYSDRNLGCMRNIVTGLTKVFEQVEKAIILEDDCNPTIGFFKFMDWGLERFKHDGQVGMISGSNLIADKLLIPNRNGFSMFINIWGWATWRDRWQLHNPFLSIREINKNCNSLLIKKGFSLWQRIYWKELFKFTVFCGDTWDFQLQYTFFKNNLLSVYPQQNLVENIGFNGNGAHMNIECPEYVKNNRPVDTEVIMSVPENNTIRESLIRDILLAQTIWSFNIYSTLKLKLKNLLIACNILY